MRSMGPSLLLFVTHNQEKARIQSNKRMKRVNSDRNHKAKCCTLSVAFVCLTVWLLFALCLFMAFTRELVPVFISVLGICYPLICI